MFEDRRDAGLRLAERLRALDLPTPVVLGLPRGGVPVAEPVARTLDAPLDIILVRKLGVPHQPELAMGAIGEDGVRVINEEVLATTGATVGDVDAAEQRERAELQVRAERYRRGHPRVPLEGRTAIVVDDGIATGSTARAALRVARAHGAAKVVLAVPVAPPRTCRAMESEADAVVCLEQPERFWAVGQFYRDFSQTTDDEVVAALDETARDRAVSHPPAGEARQPVDETVELAVGEHRLGGNLTIPSGAEAVVVFAHGSGSGRHSPRNQAVARRLNARGLGTLLLDLLDEHEAADRATVFDIDLLAERLVAATSWVEHHPAGRGLPVGYFGASTGGAAAIAAAVERDECGGPSIAAVVSRGGRPDLARAHLPRLRAPLLLLVGSRDDAVLDLNRHAATELRCEHRLEVVPGATHLFEEPGALETVAESAGDWFLEHLPDRTG